MILDLPDSGAGRFEGYTSPAATERKILRDVFQPGDRWYRSATCSLDADGYFTSSTASATRIAGRARTSRRRRSPRPSVIPGVAIANVYGVAVPARKAAPGMAALVLQPDGASTGRVLRLGGCARRLRRAALRAAAPEPDVTSTFKLRKLDLQREGYDPARVARPALRARRRARAPTSRSPRSAMRRLGDDPRPRRRHGADRSL